MFFLPPSFSPSLIRLKFNTKLLPESEEVVGTVVVVVLGTVVVVVVGTELVSGAGVVVSVGTGVIALSY